MGYINRLSIAWLLFFLRSIAQVMGQHGEEIGTKPHSECI